MTPEKEVSEKKSALPEDDRVLLPLDESIGFLLNEAARLIRAFSGQALAALNITPRHAAILLALLARSELSQHKIGEIAGIDRTSMMVFLDKLEVLGLVARQVNPYDRRAQVVSLTERGKEVALEVSQIIQETQKRFLQPLSEEEKAQLKVLLLKLRQGHIPSE